MFCGVSAGLSGLDAAVLQPGRELLAAGYALYSSAVMLVLSWGAGVHGFTLDSRLGEFVLTHPDIRVPDRGESATRTYVVAARGTPRLVEHSSSWPGMPMSRASLLDVNAQDRYTR